MIDKRRQMRRGDGEQPPDADRGEAASTAVAADGPGFGAGAIDGTQLTRRVQTLALAGDDQETDDAAGTCDVS